MSELNKNYSSTARANFNNYWEWLWNYAQMLRFGKGEWMKSSGLSAQRFSEFAKRKRNISTRYFIKLVGGLGLQINDIEKTSGQKFTDEQKTEIKFEAWVDSNRDVLMALMEDPKKLKILKDICQIG